MFHRHRPWTLRLWTLLGVALLGLATPACYLRYWNNGPPIESDLSPFQIGATTKTEVLAALGPPLSIRRQFDGDLFIYSSTEDNSATLLLIPFFAVYSRRAGESREDIVTLLFDHQGVLAGAGVQAERER